jgi:hypothetical protein
LLGTIRYFDDPEKPQVATFEHSGLKYDASGPAFIILIPQPSGDLNHLLVCIFLSYKSGFLLTWSELASLETRCHSRRSFAYLNLHDTPRSHPCYNTLTLSFYFRLKFTNIVILTGYLFLGVGIAGEIFVPSSRVWGKAHLSLLGTIISIFSSACGWRLLLRSRAYNYTPFYHEVVDSDSGMLL